jgi:hypothetical protein
LEGASRLGKTQLAITLFGHELAYVCNCQECKNRICGGSTKRSTVASSMMRSRGKR